MTFQHLLDGAEVLSQSGNPDVTSVEYDSRRVKPGSLFVAMRGESSDGNRFIDQAIQSGAVAIVTLNRPEVRNAINDALRVEFFAALDRVATDESIRAMVLTGCGKGFCAGGDISGMK